MSPHLRSGLDGPAGGELQPGLGRSPRRVPAGHEAAGPGEGGVHLQPSQVNTSGQFSTDLLAESPLLALQTPLFVQSRSVGHAVAAAGCWRGTRPAAAAVLGGGAGGLHQLGGAGRQGGAVVTELLLCIIVVLSP